MKTIVLLVKMDLLLMSCKISIVFLSIVRVMLLAVQYVVFVMIITIKILLEYVNLILFIVISLTRMDFARNALPTMLLLMASVVLSLVTVLDTNLAKKTLLDVQNVFLDIIYKTKLLVT